MDKRVIGIIGAMDIEVEQLRGLLADARTESHLGMDFTAGLLGDARVVVVMCGIGKVNAALCALELVERYGATHVINTGVAGSLDARINIGDLVVCTDAVHHDMDVRPLGYAPGQVPDMDVSTFASDEAMRAEAVAAARAVVPEMGVFEGRIASGDQFVADPAGKDRIVSAFGALCCEMEGAAIAHACYLAGVPYVVLRVISDKADGSAHMDYPTFKVEAARRCSAIVERMVRDLS